MLLTKVNGSIAHSKRVNNLSTQKISRHGKVSNWTGNIEEEYIPRELRADKRGIWWDRTYKEFILWNGHSIIYDGKIHFHEEKIATNMLLSNSICNAQKMKTLTSEEINKWKHENIKEERKMKNYVFFPAYEGHWLFKGNYTCVKKGKIMHNSTKLTDCP